MKSDFTEPVNIGSEEMISINNFAQNILARDSIYFREKMKKTSPDIEMKQEVEMGGEMVTVTIPMTTNFFWPNSEI